MTASTEFTAEKFSAIVKGIVASGAKYSKGVGAALLGALYFSIAENNAGPANELVAALRKSTKQQAIIDLLEENGNLAWCKTGKKPEFAYFDAMHTWMPEDVAELRAVCDKWEEYKKAPIAKDYDAIKAVEQIIKTIDARANDPKKGRVNGAAIKQALEAALAAYSIATYGEVC